MGERRFVVELIKPSHYDDGYVTSVLLSSSERSARHTRLSSKSVAAEPPKADDAAYRPKTRREELQCGDVTLSRCLG